MLAAAAKLEQIKYPVIASPKIDGIRCIIKDGVALSRTLKPIRNEYIQSILGKPELNGLDGELIVGPITADDVYRNTSSNVMRIKGEPKFDYRVFDQFEVTSDSYIVRNIAMNKQVLYHSHATSLDYVVIDNQDQLLAYEIDCLAQGYEGVIVRSPIGKYKHGRSTVNEGLLLKLKRFQDAEAMVIGVEELMHNDNEAVTNELGRTARSSHQEGKRPAGVLGALVCKTPEGVEFKVGTGLTAAMREQYWKMDLIGKLVKYKYFEIGIKTAPRHPVFLGFRDVEDL